MMKSLALNAVILYILFKTPVSEHVLAKLPSYVRSLKSFKELYDQIINLVWRGSRMSRRMSVVVLVVAGIWLLKKIWEHLRGYELVSDFVEKYLCDRKVMGYTVVNSTIPRMQEVDRKRFFTFSHMGGKRMPNQ